jgi:hypothetical protein
MVGIADGRYAAVPIETTGLQRKQVNVERFYDKEAFRPKGTTLLGLPMFHS